ncbi:MAG TPA: class I SAM-dependent methyltransferase, partial [Clostridia bacterium]
MQEINYEVWKTKSLVESYLTDVRGAIPLAHEQFDVILRLIKLNGRSVETFLDLGSGDGILSSVILSCYPDAKGVLLDISDHMAEAAQSKLKDFENNLDFIVYDYGNKEWVKKAEQKSPYDVIVSGLSIHHQPDQRKKEIYSEIYGLLKAGGIFINLEHVSSTTQWVSSLFEDCFADSLYEMHNKKDSSITKEQVAKELYNRSDKQANILAPVEKQCEWLREIGFDDVDCYFKIYEL